MAKVVVMPKLGYTQDTGAIAAWLKNEGDTVERGEPLFDVHTDKSVVTVEANCSGTLLKIALEPEVTVPVLTPVAVVGEPGEDADAILASHVTMEVADKQVEADFDELDDAEEEVAEEAAPAADISDLKITPRAKKYIEENNIDPASVAGIKGTGFEGGICEKDVKASPLAKKIAAKKGVDLADVKGTGVNGKIMKKDVEKAAPAAKKAAPAPAAAAPAPESKADLMIEKTVPYAGVRKIIGDRLSESKFTAPHLYFTDAVDMTEFFAFRKMLNEKGEVKIAASDLMIKAASKALQKFPGLNASLQGDQIVYYKSTNVGMAVAGDNGLIVPVVKNAQDKTLSAIAAETRDLVERAKVGRLQQSEYTGGTFSISNLGMFGIGNFTAIINPPEAGILSISSVRKTPVVMTDAEGNDTIVIRPMMNIQLSVDHRIIDGLLASQFVEYYKELLENPLSILL
jgi:pyruvate dehydrogenase E2 component (dihydrolipoamide acetyltransferase)